MNKNSPGWYERVADISPYVFWTVWGGMAGATFAVFTGEWVKIFLPIMTAFMGGWLGLYAARQRDRAEDRRKLRRKAHMARMRIRRLWSSYRNFDQRMTQTRRP